MTTFKNGAKLQKVQLAMLDTDVQDKFTGYDTTLAQKMSKGEIFINVKDYGAKGDGVTDDTASVASAIANGNRIYFPKGTYNLNLITINKDNIELFGAGIQNSIINTTSTSYAFYWDATKQYQNISIHDLNFQGLTDTAHQYQNHVCFRGAKNVKIYNNYFGPCGGVGLSNFNGLSFDNGEIFNNVFDGTRDSAIAIRPFNNIKIHDNTFKNITGFNYPAHGVYLRSDGASGTDVSSSNAYIYNNVAYDCISSNFANEHVFKVITNDPNASNTMISSIYVYNNTARNCPLFLNVSNANNVHVFNNDSRTNQNFANGMGDIRVSYIDDIYIHHNKMINESPKDTYIIYFDNVNRLDIDHNVFEKSYQAAVISSLNSGTVGKVNIRQNTLTHTDYSTNATDWYTTLFQCTTTNLSLVQNIIRTVGRCAVLIPSASVPITTFEFIRNDCIGLNTATYGPLNADSTYVTHRMQFGNIFYNFQYPKNTANDTVIAAV